MVDRCICCGEIIPEGRQVCPVCESKEDTKCMCHEFKEQEIGLCHCGRFKKVVE